MDKDHFEVNVWLHAEPRYAGTMRDLAAHAARYAGGEPRQADDYAAAVERAVLACIARLRSGTVVPVVFRRGGGPLECLIACEAGPDAGAGADRVSVSWTRDHGTPMCRVALDL
jgi:hypothetical protein